MKRIFLTITLFSILAILPFAISAQNSDDLDGDGVPNSEDACPHEKGTKTNKGCPGKDEPASIAVPATTPTPTFTPAPNPTPTPIVAKSGTFEDCKIVISEGCRSYFFQPNNDEIHWKFLFTKTKTNDVLFIWNSKAENFALVVEPSTGGILAVTFDKKSRTKPAPNLKWDESKTSVQKKYPEPQINSVGNYVYKNFIFHFEDDKLSKITLNREATEAEIIAYNTQKAANERAERAKADAEKAKAKAAEAYANTIEGKAAKLMERLNVNINYINYLTERHNKIKAGNANNRAAQIIDDNWGEIPKLLKQIEATKRQSIDFIDEFLKLYGNKIDAATKSKLLEHRQTFGGNSLKPLPRS